MTNQNQDDSQRARSPSGACVNDRPADVGLGSSTPAGSLRQTQIAEYLLSDEGANDLQMCVRAILTHEERKALDCFPADSVSHWLRGEWWDGQQWLPLRPS